MNSSIPVKTIVSIVLLVLTAILAVALGGSIVETNNAGFMQVKQAAVSGKLTCQLEPGMYLQNFGDIHTYQEAETFYFTKDTETGEERDQSLPTMFNDGTQASVSGSLRVVLPRDCHSLQALHRKFNSMDGVMSKLVLPAVRKALFNTGPHMSAGESYAERRGEFAQLAEDQLRFGVILVDKHQEEQPDPITGEPKKVWVLERRVCDKPSDNCVGGYVRDASAFAEFGVSVTNFVVDGIEYPRPVLDQIETQRKARMNVITQQAQVKEAEARASKAVAEAKAQVEETRAKEEVAKTELVVRAEADKAAALLAAEKRREVAQLDAEAAQLEKAANIARGEGESARRKLVMQADGALERKLTAWVEAQKAYAQALASAQPGALVPTVVMGGNGSTGNTAATDWMNLMMVKSAKDLALDMNLPTHTK